MDSDYKTQRLERYFRDTIVGEGLMRANMSSEACRNVRIALRYLGYDVDENDRYDEELEKAVLAFQTDNNHTALDGYVGPGTRRLLTLKLRERAGDRIFKLMTHPEGQTFPPVFISYARVDVDSARRLFNDLRESGVNVWFDEESLLPGQKWRPAIEEAIRSCRFFLALLSNNSLDKVGYVQKEMRVALEVLDEYPEFAIFLIPVRLEVCQPSDYRLRDLNWVDMFPKWEDGLMRIHKAIASQW
jgi:hypothetical protein